MRLHKKLWNVKVEALCRSSKVRRYDPMLCTYCALVGVEKAANEGPERRGRNGDIQMGMSHKHVLSTVANALRLSVNTAAIPLHRFLRRECAVKNGFDRVLGLFLHGFSVAGTSTPAPPDSLEIFVAPTDLDRSSVHHLLRFLYPNPNNPHP
ncbi:hypothetical protein C8J57DRAFT_1235155 [Mycena rebaudengoi]|nr:hypothetical protein C8J57DRAFT_1235155 [Mycena rebaudengoi]